MEQIYILGLKLVRPVKVILIEMLEMRLNQSSISSLILLVQGHTNTRLDFTVEGLINRSKVGLNQSLQLVFMKRIRYCDNIPAMLYLKSIQRFNGLTNTQKA